MEESKIIEALKKLKHRQAHPPKQLTSVVGGLQYAYCRFCGWLTGVTGQAYCRDCKKLMEAHVIDGGDHAAER